MAEAGYAPGILFFCNIWFPQKYRAQTMSFVFLAPSIAGVRTSAAVGFALINSVAGLGGFFGTIIFGWVTDLTGNYSRSLWLSAGAAVLAGLLCIAAARIPWTSARRSIAVGLRRTLD
jgi:predicted MFS family arabinose efflux permease